MVENMINLIGLVFVVLVKVLSMIEQHYDLIAVIARSFLLQCYFLLGKVWNFGELTMVSLAIL